MKNIILGTSCYENANLGNLVSVTGDGGNAWGFYGDAYKKLAPSWDLYTTWRDNPENLTQDELINFYIKEYFEHRLMNLDVQELLQELNETFGDQIILLCHELPGDFCHRRLIADFIELESGLFIPELLINKNGETKTLEQPDYKPRLRELRKHYEKSDI